LGWPSYRLGSLPEEEVKLASVPLDPVLQRFAGSYIAVTIWSIPPVFGRLRWDYADMNFMQREIFSRISVNRKL
jgi:hypothetical protein